MNKLGIWGLVIAAAFVVGVLSANPVVEAAGGWKVAVIELSGDISDIELFLEERSDFWEFLEESGEEAFESQVYEVSAVSLIRADERNGNEVQLRCLEGDRFLNDKPILRLTIPPGLLPDTFDIGFKSSDTREIFEFQPLIGGDHVIIIGYDTTPFADGLLPPLDIPVTVTGLCLSPSS